MAVSRKAMTEGIRTAVFPSILNNAPLQSLSQKSKIFASSLYTREPGCSRTSAFIDVSQKNQRIVPHSFLTVSTGAGNSPRLLFSLYFFKSAAMTRFMASMPTFTAPEVSSVMGIASPAFSRS